MVRGFHYRFYPSPKQQIALAKAFGCARFVYNWALHLRSKAWQERQERVSYNATSAALTKLKTTPEVAWLNEVSCVPLQQSLRHLKRRSSTSCRTVYNTRRSRRREPAVGGVHPLRLPVGKRAAHPGEDRQAEDSLVAELSGRSHHDTR